ALNLTSDQFAQVRSQAAANNLTWSRPAPGAINRRGYFLAVNHRLSPLGNVHVRKALAPAINPRKLLGDCFRAGLPRPQVHKAINSLYPADSWPCDPKIKGPNGLDPFDEGLAKGRLNMLASQGVTLKGAHFVLKYANNEPDVDKAMKALCAQ